MTMTKSEIDLSVSPTSEQNSEKDEHPTLRLQFVRRGETVDEDAVSEDIASFDAERMRARMALTIEEERSC